MSSRADTVFTYRSLVHLALVGLVTLATSVTFAAPRPIEISNSNFIAVAASTFETLAKTPSETPEKVTAGEVVFLPLEHLIRAQDQISVDNIKAKVLEHQEFGNLTEKNGSWQFAHDSGRSVVPANDPIQVVRGPDGFVIVDGHHDAYLSLFLGTRTIAAQVREDLSHLSRAEFWKVMKARHLVYLTASAESLAARAPAIREVRDNPNRYLAALVALKAGVKEGAITKVKGPQDAAWVKVGDSIPFIEFEIARVLAEAGIMYRPAWGSAIPPEVVHQIRVVLARSNDADIRAIPVLSDATESRESRVDTNRLTVVVRGHSCKALF